MDRAGEELKAPAIAFLASLPKPISQSPENGAVTVREVMAITLAGEAFAPLSNTQMLERAIATLTGHWNSLGARAATHSLFPGKMSDTQIANALRKVVERGMKKETIRLVKDGEGRHPNIYTHVQDSFLADVVPMSKASR